MWHVASTTDLYRDLSSNPKSILDPTDVSLHERVNQAVKLAERCVTARQKYEVEEAFEELDTTGTNLWNLINNLTLDMPEDPEDNTRATRVLRGAQRPFVSLDFPPLTFPSVKFGY